MKYLILFLIIIGFNSCIIMSKSKYHHKLHDYQIELDMDTVYIYDGKRLVERFVSTDWNSKYDSVFIRDNL